MNALATAEAILAGYQAARLLYRVSSNVSTVRSMYSNARWTFRCVSQLCAAVPEPSDEWELLEVDDKGTVIVYESVVKP